MRRAAKVDNSQAPIIAMLRANGMTVKDCSKVGQGFPDLCVAFRGGTFLLECKTRRDDCNRTKDEPRTQAQIDFAATWAGEIGFVSSPEAALEFVLKMAKAEGRL